MPHTSVGHRGMQRLLSLKPTDHHTKGRGMGRLRTVHPHKPAHPQHLPWSSLQTCVQAQPNHRPTPANISQGTSTVTVPQGSCHCPSHCTSKPSLVQASPGVLPAQSPLHHQHLPLHRPLSGQRSPLAPVVWHTAASTLSMRRPIAVVARQAVGMASATAPKSLHRHTPHRQGGRLSDTMVVWQMNDLHLHIVLVLAAGVRACMLCSILVVYS